VGSCVFCRIAQREEHAYIVYEGGSVVVFLDIYPVEKGHLLVVPVKHYESSTDVDECTICRVFTTAAVFSRIYIQELGAPGVNILANSGRAAGQEIFHFHVHVIPRWSGGGWKKLLSRRVLVDSEAEEVLSMLKPYTHYVDQSLSRLKC